MLLLKLLAHSASCAEKHKKIAGFAIATQYMLRVAKDSGLNPLGPLLLVDHHSQLLLCT